jgi:streptogramin lyase
MARRRSIKVRGASVRPRLILEPLEDRRLLAVSITEFPIPTTGAGFFAITTGPDGNLWFTESNSDKVGTINPTTHVVTDFPVPSGSGSVPAGITAGPDGNLTEIPADLQRHQLGSRAPR